MAKRAALNTARQALLSEGAVFVVPDDAIYFCIDHQCFHRNRPDAERHLSEKTHATRGWLRCNQCCNWFPSKRELDLHTREVGKTHHLPFPTRLATLRDGRISAAGDQEEEEGGEKELREEEEGEVAVPMAACATGGHERVTVMSVNMVCIQGIIYTQAQYICSCRDHVGKIDLMNSERKFLLISRCAVVSDTWRNPS